MTDADTFTPNLHLRKIAANRKVWAESMDDNLTLIDGVISSFFSVANMTGVWQNSYAYSVGEAVVDSTSAVVYVCETAHISAGIPTTFAEDRAANSNYWSVYSSPARARGAWQSGVLYAVNDFVVSGSQYAVALTSHVSGASFAADAANWSILVDLSAAGSQVLPIPGGAADANKFVMTTSAGLSYSIYDDAQALAALGATSVGADLFTAASATAARTAIGTYSTSEIDTAISNARQTLSSLSDSVYTDFGTPRFSIATTGNQNGFVGQVINNLASGALSYPTAITAYGRVIESGNIVWGAFGRADLWSVGKPGVATNEFNTFNFAGAPVGTIPPNLGLGTTEYNPIGAIMAAYGDYDSLMAIAIMYGGVRKFKYGIYMHPEANDLWGFVMDASASYGPSLGGGLIRTNGSVPHLTLQTMGSPTGSAAVFRIMTGTGVVNGYFNQDGDWITPGIIIGHDGTIDYLTATIAGTATAGAAVLPAAPVAFRVEKIAGTSYKVPLYNV